jgi:hypothetical protein
MINSKFSVEEAIRTLKRICFVLPPMPLPRLNYIDKSAKFKDEILANVKTMIQVDELEELDQNEDSLFGGEEIKCDNNNMNESDFIDFKLLNMNSNRLSSERLGSERRGGSIAKKLVKEKEINPRLSILSDFEDRLDDRSIILTNNMGEDYK